VKSDAQRIVSISTRLVTLYLFFIIFALSLTFSYLTSILLLFTLIKFFNLLLIELKELSILQFATFLLLENLFTNFLNLLITFKS